VCAPPFVPGGHNMERKRQLFRVFTPQSVSFGLYPVIKQIVSWVPNCAVQFHYDIITRSRCRGPAVPTEKLDTQSMWETNLKGPVFLQLTLSPPPPRNKKCYATLTSHSPPPQQQLHLVVRQLPLLRAIIIKQK
jgi:hypothetical protein